MTANHAPTLGLIAVLAATSGFAADLPPVGPLPQPRPAVEAKAPPQAKPEIQGPPAPPKPEGPLKGTVLTPEAELVVTPESAEDHAACVSALATLRVAFT